MSGFLRLVSFVASDNALALGLYPFIAGDLLKLAVAALMLPVGWKGAARRPAPHAPTPRGGPRSSTGRRRGR